MNNNPTNTSEALARLQAAAEYAARPSRITDRARSLRVQPMPDFYRQAVEEFRLWSKSITAREKDFKKGRTPETGISLESFDVKKQWFRSL